jgi:hypothetical protein
MHEEKLPPFVFFWRDRFVEHLDVVDAIAAMRLDADQIAGISKQTLQLASELRSWHRSTSRDEIFHALSGMQDLKEHVLALLLPSDCFRDVMSHMIGELHMVENFIRHGCSSKRKTILAWATEHTEDNHFLVCLLTMWVNSPSADAHHAIEICRELALLFAELDGNDVLAFLELSDHHVANLAALQRQIIPTLPLEDNKKQLLTKMIQHEVLEAVWAQSFIARKL